VAQQDGGATAAVAGEAALERDADASAAGAVASLWAPDHPLAARLQRRPRLRDGLALRSCSTEKKDKKPPAAPARAPTPEFKDEAMPSDPKAVYDQKLPEAVTKLKVAFGRAEAETGKYDHDLWDKVKATKTGEEALQLKPGIKPSVGMDAMFARLSEWSLDCAQFVQVAHLYALRWALGSTTFNNRVGAVRFLLRAEGDSTLLEGNAYWRRLDPRSPFRKYSGSKDEPVKDSADELLTAAPTGSRVMWTNELAAPGTAFEHENTIKLGPDSFAAHGFGKQKIFGRRELERNLALIANKDADDAWIDAHVFIQLIEIYRTSENPTGQ
jgi:hypothetical protein